MRRRGKSRYLVAVIGVIAGLLSFQGTAAADTFSAPGFATERVATVPPYTLVGMAFAPDGRLFVWQKNGIVRVIKNGQLLPTPFIDLSAKVNTYDDRGFWGLAFDPQFATNGRVYMSYTFENAGNPNSNDARTARLTRVTADPANPDTALPGSEVVILGSVGTPPCSAQPASADCIGSDGGSHTLGSLHFADDGTLFVGVGDGSDGDARLAARPGPEQPEREDPADQARRERATGQPVLRRHELLAIEGVAVRSPQPLRVLIASRDRGDLLRRRRVEHMGGGQPRRCRDELRLAVLRGERSAAVLPESVPRAVRPDRGHSAVPHLRPRQRLRGDRRAVLYGHGLSAAVPERLLLRRLHGELHQAGGVRFRASAGLGATVRDRRPEPGRSHSGSRRNDLLPVVHDGRDPADPIRRTGRESGGHADQRTFAALGVVLERRVEQPGRRGALIPLGLRGRRDLDRRQSVSYLHDVDSPGGSRLGSP